MMSPRIALHDPIFRASLNGQNQQREPVLAAARSTLAELAAA
jgi:hypothetical protein